MKIEVLFPEVCNLYGELGNIRYLKQSCPEIEIIETSLNEVPYFENNEPNLIYMGTMTEKSQLIIIDRLKKYKKRLVEHIDKGTHFLITGNAIEIFGKQINDKNGTIVECLNIFNTIAKRDMFNRFNSLYLGEFENEKIVGYKSQFSHSWLGEDEKLEGLFKTLRGTGFNPEVTEEGIRCNNFMGTYIIGPILVLNPPFTKHLLRLCGIEKELAFEKEAMDVYNARVAEYSDPKRGVYY